MRLLPVHGWPTEGCPSSGLGRGLGHLPPRGKTIETAAAVPVRTLTFASYYKVVVIKVPLQGQNATIDKVLWIGLNLLPQDGFRKAPTMALCF